MITIGTIALIVTVGDAKDIFGICSAVQWMYIKEVNSIMERTEYNKWAKGGPVHICMTYDM